MTDLHWALLAIAAVLLLVLFVYSKWQERRVVKELDASLRSGVGDPLLAPRAPVEARSASQPNVRIEPILGPTESVAPSAPATSDRHASADHRTAQWLEDPMLDFVLELRCVHPVDGVAAIEAGTQLVRLALPLPTHLAVWDPRAQEWTAPDRFGFYSEMLVALQMANRRHALTEIEASHFVATVQQIALAVDADFDPPDVQRLMQQAAELDRLCAHFDLQISLTLESNSGPWNNDLLHTVAEEQGFERIGPSRWQCFDGRGRPLLIMSTASLLADRLAVTLDVPLAAEEAQPIRELFAIANQLAPRLNARIVDDNAQLVEPSSLGAIEAQLATLYAEMREAGIQPGSSRARRLYVG